MIMAIEKQIESIDLSVASYASKTTVVGQEDIPALGVREMQESVEYMPRNLLLPKLNEVVGAVNQCYTKAETDKAIGDKMTEIGAGDMAKAVYDPNGEGLNFTDLRKTMQQAAVLQTDVGNLKCAAVSLPVDGWNDTAPYTQTVSVSGMTADWVPGIPTAVLGSSVEVTALLAATEALGCIKMVTSAAGTLTFTAPENKPGVSLTLRVPGQIERR
uniref:Uncharacterized protein n=1 Tax=Myoviridae sp. ctuev19 TaxID=2827716 RepID=A0A8S5SG85_9CAUD|nr:MAG TPA: hypothetical protein [Myoviridae sp. ctuev19]